MAAQVRPTIRFPDVGEWPTAVKLAHEKDALGFFIPGTPSQHSKMSSPSFDSMFDRPLPSQKHDQEVTVAGMVSTSRKVRTKRGNDMGFVTIEDELGGVECVFFLRTLGQLPAALGRRGPISSSVESSRSENTENGEECKIIAHSARVAN